MPQDDFWNKLKKRVLEVSSAAADFTEEQALIGKLKFDILNLKRKADRTQREIGARICELAEVTPRPDALADRDIKRAIKVIADLIKQIDKKRDEISQVADQVRAGRKPRADDSPKPKPRKAAGGRKKSTGSTSSRQSKRAGTTKKRGRASTKAKPEAPDKGGETTVE